MFFRQIMTAATLTLLPLAASATTLFVPVSGTGPGANGSRWATELTIHSVSSRTINADVLFHDLNGATEPSTITVAPRATVSVDDIVKTRFAKDSATGALEIRLADSDANRVTLNSRTYNITANGTLGQDIPALLASDAATAGDLTVIAGPSSAADQRFNFGIYAIETTKVQWDLLQADGTIAATKELTYQAGTQAQHGVGVVTLFGATPADGQTVHATIESGSAIFYGSAVDNRSGDPTYVPALRARGDLSIDLAGIDEDENGTVDLLDADRDGVIDTVLEVPTSMFPSYFRIVVNGGAATYTLVSSPVDVTFLDQNGTTMVAAGGNVKGTIG
ncbi:MAG: hypothetical protein ACXV7D_10300, partial [Thermoanaerobaculia bacterium]